MAATNSKALSVKPWQLYVALLDETVPKLESDWSNAVEHRAALEALNYIRISSITDASVSDNLAANIVKVETDDNGLIYASTEPDATLTGNFFEIEPDVLDKILPTSKISVAWTLVSGATQDVLADAVAYWDFVKIGNQNWDGSALTVNSVTGSVDWALTLTTDYTVEANSDGVYWIKLVSGGTITTLTQVFTINYDYTPNAATMNYLIKEGIEIPRLVVKIKAMYTPTKYKIDYLADCGFEGELIKSYSDINRVGSLTPTPFNFQLNRSGSHLFYDDYNV